MFLYCQEGTDNKHLSFSFLFSFFSLFSFFPFFIIVFQFYGDPTPEGAPPAVAKIIGSIVQWFIDSGTTSDVDGVINDSASTLCGGGVGKRCDTLWYYMFQVTYWIIVWSILATFLSTLVASGSFVFRTRQLWKRISAVSRAQKKLIRTYFDPQNGWKEFPPELKQILTAAGIKAPIPVHFKYQTIHLSAPFPALFLWCQIGPSFFFPSFFFAPPYSYAF